MRNACAASEYLHSESGDPLAAGLSEWAVSVCTAGHTGYMTAQAGLDICPLLLYVYIYLEEQSRPSDPLLSRETRAETEVIHSHRYMSSTSAA